PIPNLIVDRIAETVGLERGVAVPFFHAVESGCGDISAEAGRIARGEATVEWPDGFDLEIAIERARRESARALDGITANRAERDRRIASVGEADKPWLYEIVATGDILEDIPQAQAAAREGCDIVAVIRSTGQSLLDHVPQGMTREGFAGTYATRENFRLMRAALDEVSEELGRYIRLTNYASGLCMPEIAALAGMERLDMMLNDCMYGIIFRDINMQRTFVDQHFSRMIHALAGIIINTGEDNYLTTADAFDAAHTVLASQFLNERLALVAGLMPEQMGLGHAFEIDPARPDQVVHELAHEQLIRECFPDAPLKYMPPTKHMTGNVFQGFLYDGMFNLVAALTGQDIILLGMMTEGIHTPFLSDRDLALENARYVLGGAAGLAGDISFEPGGAVARRAATVLEETRQMLQKVAELGMFAAIEAGMFADTVRTRTGGRGLDGVVRKADGYINPIAEQLTERVGA
ncbi:MAG TPA: lysine 5,6-aminomutase subunit alpha, partial [Actinomycetota bacterium]|nr:lysine 5,6-aminomutase subunit alpha [Actinomycetota bacterium]